MVKPADNRGFPAGSAPREREVHDFRRSRYRPERNRGRPGLAFHRPGSGASVQSAARAVLPTATGADSPSGISLHAERNARGEPKTVPGTPGVGEGHDVAD